MLTSIDVKFMFDSARLWLFSSTNILQIADVLKQVKSLLFLFLQIKQLNLVPSSSQLMVH